MGYEMKDHAEIMRALLDGKTIRLNYNKNLSFRLHEGMLFCFKNGKAIPGNLIFLQQPPQEFSICPDGTTVIETKVSVGAPALFSADVFKKLSENRNSIWKCTLERIR